MKSPKFDEHDRKKVIAEVEVHFGVQLSTVGSRHKFLEAKDGRTYWVLGGYEDWHGIPPDMFEEEERRRTNGVLVVAKRYPNRIDVYSGPLQPLIESKGTLSHTQKGEYQFNIHIRGSHLFVKEVQGLSLTKLAEAPYSAQEKDSDKKAKELAAIFDELSPDEQRELLKRFSNEQKT